MLVVLATVGLFLDPLNIVFVPLAMATAFKLGYSPLTGNVE